MAKERAPWQKTQTLQVGGWVFGQSPHPVKKLSITETGNSAVMYTIVKSDKPSFLPPFSFIRDFGKQNTRGNVSKIFGNLACYRQIGSKSTNHSH